MTASELFREEARKIPSHAMHVHARLVVTMFLVRRYGAALVERHRARLARALANIDKQLSGVSA